MDGGREERPPSRRSCAELGRSLEEGRWKPSCSSAGGCGSPAKPPRGVRGERWGRSEGTHPCPAPPRGWGVGQPRPPAAAGPAGVCDLLPRELRRGGGTGAGASCPAGSGDGGADLGCRRRYGAPGSRARGAPCARGGAARGPTGWCGRAGTGRFPGRILTAPRQQSCASPRAGGGRLAGVPAPLDPVTLGTGSVSKRASLGRLPRVEG